MSLLLRPFFLASLLVAALLIGAIEWVHIGRENDVGVGPSRFCEESDQPTASGALSGGPPASPPGVSFPLPSGLSVHLSAPGERIVDPRRPSLDARLALRYEPILEIAKEDRFWPIAVPTVLALRARQAGGAGETQTQFVIPGKLRRNAKLSDLRPRGSPDEFIDFPTKINHTQDAFCSVGHALGIPLSNLAQWRSRPDALRDAVANTAQIYFFVRRLPRGGEEVQYWFFYPYNYYPTLIGAAILTNPIGADYLNSDFHEGDFEHIAVDGVEKPGGSLDVRSVLMARHSGEDRTLAWDGSDGLQRIGDHPVVYVSLGGHASYNSCGPEPRHPGTPLGPFVHLTDWTLCDSTQAFILSAQTPLVNLRDVSWACWPGHFGGVPRLPLPQYFVAGPPSPLRRGDNAAAAGCPPV